MVYINGKATEIDVFYKGKYCNKVQVTSKNLYPNLDDINIKISTEEDYINIAVEISESFSSLIETYVSKCSPILKDDELLRGIIKILNHDKGKINFDVTNKEDSTALKELYKETIYQMVFHRACSLIIADAIAMNIFGPDNFTVYNITTYIIDNIKDNALSAYMNYIEITKAEEFLSTFAYKDFKYNLSDFID